MGSFSRFTRKAAGPLRRIVLPASLLLVLAGVATAVDPVSRASSEPAGRQKPMREIVEKGYRVQLDLSTQVLRLAVPEDRTWSMGPEAQANEAPVAATLSRLGQGGLVSASMLAQKAKQFDDGLYAAVDLAAQQGAGDFEGKAAFLARLARRLTAPGAEPSGNAQAVVLGGAGLGKVPVDLPPNFRLPVRTLVDEFLGNELRSKPIAFYTWTDELAAIFQQDRMLQTELEGKAGIEAVVKALAADTQSAATYEAYLALVSKLTNPLAYDDLREQLAALEAGRLDAPDDEVYFFPPSKSHETELVKMLYDNRPIPEGFSLVDEMIRRIRSGALDLKPTASSGWYDYQTWSLEPLVIPEQMPEAKHLELDASYRKQLLELFKGILALTRETHIKQLENPTPGEAAPFTPPRPIIHVYPELTAEPLATFYLRRAWSYAVVRRVLEGTFGPQALATMHRLTAAGPVRQDLAAELRDMESLFYGAHLTVCRQIGSPASTSHQASMGSPQGAAPDEARFQTWTKDLAADPDVARDARMMVPVFYDLLRKKTKVWAFLGWAERPVQISFARRPEATVFDRAGKVATDSGPELKFHSLRRSLAYPVTAEVYVTKILNRDEFRRHCDRHKTRSAILANLE